MSFNFPRWLQVGKWVPGVPLLFAGLYAYGSTLPPHPEEYPRYKNRKPPANWTENNSYYQQWHKGTGDPSSIPDREPLHPITRVLLKHIITNDPMEDYETLRQSIADEAVQSRINLERWNKPLEKPKINFNSIEQSHTQQLEALHK